jgi:hypothetical protein
VAPMPLPGALWLLGSALAGLGCLAPEDVGRLIGHRAQTARCERPGAAPRKRCAGLPGRSSFFGHARRYHTCIPLLRKTQPGCLGYGVPRCQRTTRHKWATP